MLLDRTSCFWTSQAKTHPIKVAVFDLERSRGSTFFDFWGHPTTQYRQKSPPLFQPFPTRSRLPCLPMDRSDPRPPDLCGHSCERPLSCPKIQNISVFREVLVRPKFAGVFYLSAPSRSCLSQNCLAHKCDIIQYPNHLFGFYQADSNRQHNSIVVYFLSLLTLWTLK